MLEENICNEANETPLALKALDKRFAGNDQQAQELHEAVLDVLWHTDSDDKRFITVVYLLCADKYVGPLPSRLNEVNQPVIMTPYRFSTLRLHLLTHI